MAQRLSTTTESQLAPGPGHNALAPDDFVKAWLELKAYKRKLDEANGTYRAHRKKMEGMGVDLKSLALLEQLSKLETPEEQSARLKRTVQYAGFLSMPLGSQLELFAAGVQPEAPGQTSQSAISEAAANDAGYEAGKEGGNREDNPYPAGSPLHVAWDDGWVRGQEYIAERMERGLPPRAVKKKADRPAPIPRGGSRRGRGQRTH